MQNREGTRTEAETAARLAETLPQLLEGLKLTKVRLEMQPRGPGPDISVQIEVGTTKRTLAIEVKQIGEPRIALQAIGQLQRLGGRFAGAYPVLAAPYLTESARLICKEAGVGYIDLSGNVFLRFDGVFIERTTAHALKQERRALRGLTMPRTSRVIRRCLSDPSKPFMITELAALTGVSPAQVFKVANLLEMKGYAKRDEGRRLLLIRPSELLEAWAGSLDFRKNTIVPAYSLARTPEAIMKSLAEVAAKGGKRYALTMFAGASLIAPSVRFYDVTCYVEREVEWWLKKLDLERVETGSNVQLVVPRDDSVLAESQKVGRYKVASDIQLFADLYGDPARGREAAETLRLLKLRFRVTD